MRTTPSWMLVAALLFSAFDGRAETTPLASRQYTLLRDPLPVDSTSRNYTLAGGELIESWSREATLERGPQFCTPDLNFDGVVNFADLNLILGNFNQSYPYSGPGDVDLSGTVDFADLNIVLGAWGAHCS